MPLALKSRWTELLGRNRRVFCYLLGPCCLATAWFLLAVKPQRAKTAKLLPLETPSLRPQQPFAQEYSGDSSVYNSPFNIILELENAPEIDAHSLTAILPVTLEVLPNLQETIVPLFNPSTRLREIHLVCPENILSHTRRMIHKIVAAAENFTHPDISLRPWNDNIELNEGVLRAASQVLTDWVLVLPITGLQTINSGSQDMLLVPKAIAVPVGPRGVVLSPNISCVIPSQNPQPASYLLPPFVVPSSFVRQLPQSSLGGVWAALGEQISRLRLDGLGGIVTGFADSDLGWCYSISKHGAPPLDEMANSEPDGPACNVDVQGICAANRLMAATQDLSGVFAFLLPTRKDLQLFSPVACRLQENGHLIHILLYDEPSSYEHPTRTLIGEEERTINSGRCRLKYNVISVDKASFVKPLTRTLFLLEWMEALESPPDVVLAANEQASVITGLSSILERPGFFRSTLIHLPSRELPYCAWMSSLSLNEWKNWNTPKIDVSIITKDRPQSLARLLTSLSTAIFFGDSLNLRVNLEQSSDPDTLQMIDNLKWEHGSLFVHHRVIHGGLLPAVVESWYPHSNDTYGLLLEDDVELSPLFYAWLKMSILRYRHGDHHNQSPRLFGISLYQQKNIELRPDGRKPFDARALFSGVGLPYPSTPYLSQIPCSWGAVYFPEHWREFHEYLSVRLSEYSIKIEQNIVPDVRSNNWTKSWKKYFVELVYLRGYVMLYPNYKNFISLSTNHLEVGSHVKERSKEKRDSFVLPLMTLPIAHSPSSLGLLDLPDRTLPSWRKLPILNLTGCLTTLDDLTREGRLRRAELLGCLKDPSYQYDIRDLMCIDNTPN